MLSRSTLLRTTVRGANRQQWLRLRIFLQLLDYVNFSTLFLDLFRAVWEPARVKFCQATSYTQHAEGRCPTATAAGDAQGAYCPFPAVAGRTRQLSSRPPERTFGFRRPKEARTPSGYRGPTPAPRRLYSMRLLTGHFGRFGIAVSSAC